MNPRWVALGAVLLAAASTPAVRAQQHSAQSRPRSWTLSLYAGGSGHSPVGHRWGLTPDRRHMQIGLHATVPIVRRPRWSLRYAPEVTPLLIVTNNPTYHRGTSESGRSATVEAGRAPVAAFGFAPIGFEGQQHLMWGIRSYESGALGALWFTRATPVLGSRAFNFTFEFGGGLIWPLGPRLALRTGYKFHHFSNAKTAPQNPGVDAEMFFAGVERTFGRPLGYP